MKHRLGISRGIAAMVPLALVAAVGVARDARAFDIDTGNPDFKIRWDTELRYNLGVRTSPIDPRLKASNPAMTRNTALTAIGDNQFNAGDVMLNRLDGFSELDLVYKDRSGIRISGAGWYDGTYGETVKDATSYGLANQFYTGGRYSGYTKGAISGPSGEFLDSFAFTSFDVGQTTTSLKFGRHNIYWGNSLFPGSAHASIAVGQAPLDLAKQAMSPGIETKELELPMNQITGTFSATPALSISAQYSMEWRHSRFPEAGTYYEYGIFGVWGPNGVLAGPDKFRPADHGGDWGLMAKYSPDAWDGTNVSLVYREFYEKAPANFYATGLGVMGMAYNSHKNQLLGLATETNLFGINFGAELSYHKNASLKTSTFFNTLLDSQTQEAPARGDLFGGVVNAVKLLPANPVFEAGELAAEIAYSQVDKVTYNPGLNAFGPFLGYGAQGTPAAYQVVGSPFCRDSSNNPGKGSEDDGCASKGGAWVASVNLTPRWLQVIPGVDLSSPVFVAYGLHGTGNGANIAEGQYVYQLALQADIREKYVVKLAYTDGWSPIHMKSNGDVGGSGTYWQNDRGWVNLSLKTSF